MSREKRAARKEKKLARMTAEQDIRYRGPLSYRAFKLLGWLCIILSQVAVLLSLEARLDPTMTESLQAPITALRSAADLALPFLLIANFALILNHSEGYAAQIRKYVVMNVLVVAVTIFLFSRYAVGAVAIVTEDRAAALALLQEVFWTASGTGYFAYNIFTDLLLCSLLMFFLNYRPEKTFTGKKLLIFRCFAVLPVAYEAASIVLKLLSSAGKLRLPLIVFPFLTVKPPLTFLVFLVLAAFIKTRELRWRRTGRTHEDYLAFLGTKRNSWDFSVFTAWTLAIAGLLDLIVVVAYVIAQAGPEADAAGLDVMGILRSVSGLGLGESTSLLLLAPIMLLFSYTRTHKNKTFDLLIPVIGVAGVVIAYLEGLYQFLLMLPDMVGPYVDAFAAEYGPMLELMLAGLPGMTG